MRATGSGGTLKFDGGSTGPITVVNSNDTVIAQPGNDNWIQAIVSYTLPASVDALFLFAGAQGTGNSDAAGDALYALDTVNTQTLTGNSVNDAFLVYNSSDVVVPKAGSHDAVYSAVNYTLPTGIDTLLLEAGTHGVGNSDAAGDALYAADAGIAQTLTGNSANDVFVVYNSADVVTPKAGSHDVVYSAVSYTLPTAVDVLVLEAGTQGVGNSDAAGDALWAVDAGIAQTLTGRSHNDSFVVYNSADVVVGQAGSTDTVYVAANFTLPTNVDTLFLEGSASRGTGNSDAVDALFGNRKRRRKHPFVAGSGADTLGRHRCHRRHHSHRWRRARHLRVPQRDGARRDHQLRDAQGHAAVQRHAVRKLHGGDEPRQPVRGEHGVHHRRQRYRDARQHCQDEPHGWGTSTSRDGEGIAKGLNDRRLDSTTIALRFVKLSGNIQPRVARRFSRGQLLMSPRAARPLMLQPWRGKLSGLPEPGGRWRVHRHGLHHRDRASSKEANALGRNC